MHRENICECGIKGLDEAIGGGFDRGSLILLEGPPGAGKSIFAAKFVHHGAKVLGEKGIYVSFGVSKKQFYQHMKTLGMDFSELEEKNLIVFLDYPTIVDKKSLDNIFRSLIDEIMENNARRIVIDPVTILTRILPPIELEATIRNILKRVIEDLNATALLVANVELEQDRQLHSVLEFMADVVLRIRVRITEAHEIKRTLEIVKFRGRGVKKYSLELYIGKEGIHVRCV